MSEADNVPAADIGLALLLGGGVGEAMAGIEATLSTVQGAAAQLFSGLARVQALGAAAAAVPPAPAPVRASPEMAAAPLEASRADRPAERFAPPPAMPPAGPEQVAAFAPVSVPGRGLVTPLPGPATASAPVANALAAPTPAVVSDDPPPATAEEYAAPVLLAAFAPTAPATEIAHESGVREAGAEPAEPWAAKTPRDTRQPWQGPAAPVADPGGGAAPQRPVEGAKSAERSGPTGGDVFLDGARVGTWIADYLAHEAARPQAGGTGFDPRLTPAWPGTLQGN